MNKIYYVVENAIGEAESKECKTLAEAQRELKRCEKYYKDNGIEPLYKLLITKYEEEDCI